MQIPKPPDRDSVPPDRGRALGRPPDIRSYFSNELVRLFFPRNPHHLIMGKQRCALTSPCPVLTLHT